MLKKLIPMICCALLVGCAMPTKPEQITASYVSPVKYKNYTCDELDIELGLLSQRESRLVQAQNQRYSSSELQAFLWGFGDGDGIEASELAGVRGEIEAVRDVYARQCRGAKVESKVSSTN